MWFFRKSPIWRVAESYGYEMNTLRRESIVLEVYNKKQLVLLFVLLSINNTNCFWRNGIRLIKSSKFPVSIENICLIYIIMICFWDWWQNFLPVFRHRSFSYKLEEKTVSDIIWLPSLSKSFWASASLVIRGIRLCCLIRLSSSLLSLRKPRTLAKGIWVGAVWIFNIIWSNALCILVWVSSLVFKTDTDWEKDNRRFCWFMIRRARSSETSI